MPSYRVSIDPGITGTGLAFWRTDSWDKAIRPYGAHIVAGPKGLSWEERAAYVRLRCANLCNKLDVENIYIEQPQFFDSGRGHVAARKGSLMKLCYFTGTLAGTFAEMELPVELIPITKWLGQMTTRQLHPRVRMLTGKSYKSHALYAVGLGLYVKGLL